MPPPAIETLRRQLREKFPQAHAFRAEPGGPDGSRWIHSRWTRFRQGRFPRWSAVGPCRGLVCGCRACLRDPLETDPGIPELVLIDGSDSFDPESFSRNTCSRLLVGALPVGERDAQGRGPARAGWQCAVPAAGRRGLSRKELTCLSGVGLVAAETDGRGQWQPLGGDGGVSAGALRRTPLAACRRDLSLGDFDLPAGELAPAPAGGERTAATGELKTCLPPSMSRISGRGDPAGLR